MSETIFFNGCLWTIENVLNPEEYEQKIEEISRLSVDEKDKADYESQKQMLTNLLGILREKDCHLLIIKRTVTKDFHGFMFIAAPEVEFVMRDKENKVYSLYEFESLL